MGKLFVLLLIVAAFTGVYWMIMSGYAADRMIALDIRAAARENDAQSILDRLREAEQGINAERRWVGWFRFIARDPDWSQAQETRKLLHELQNEATDIVAVSGGEIAPEGGEQLRKYLRTMPALHVGAFREGQDTVWKVLFWVSAAGVVILGLLLFVRRMGD